ncbi:MAG TPA: TlpA family protein disulfide reductase [bacterium]|nr:TlpA family protein disulfide reductase [bacterium]
MSRRTWISLLVPIVLLGGYFGVMTWIRGHVDELIQHAVDRPLPEFSVSDREGREWSTAGLRGRIVVLHFFRSRCHSCDLETDAVRELERDAGDDVQWLHVMTDTVLDFDPATTRNTIEAKRFSQPIVMADEAFMDLFHQRNWAQVTPVTYIVDRDGVVRYALRGAQTVETVRAAIRAVR